MRSFANIVAAQGSIALSMLNSLSQHIPSDTAAVFALCTEQGVRLIRLDPRGEHSPTPANDSDNDCTVCIHAMRSRRSIAGDEDDPDRDGL